MATKKKTEKSTKTTEDKMIEENMFANSAAINALTDIIASYDARLKNLEGNMENVGDRLRQVLSRMGL